MNAEGRVDIGLPSRPGGHVRVAYRRPLDVGPLLRGKTPETVPPILAALHAICGNAQAHAAVLALEAAMGIRTDRGTDIARAVLTAMETLRENVLRVALDWPRLAGGRAEGAAVRPVMQFTKRMQTALFADGDPFAIGATAMPDRQAAFAIVDDAEALLSDVVFGEPVDVWLSRRNADGAATWPVTSGNPAGRLGAHLAAHDWTDAATKQSAVIVFPNDDDLATWLDGIPMLAADEVPEATLYARRRSDDLLPGDDTMLETRFLARLVELARLPGEMRALIGGTATPFAGAYARPGAGIGAVEAARGLLLHIARLQEGRVKDYRIVSPTDWNFARHGVAARCLEAVSDCSDAGERLELAHLVVNAIDPCVAYDVRMH